MINNLEAKNLETSQFSDMVLNGKEQEFMLKILRDNQELEILVKKSDVSISSVSGKIFEKDNKKIGYIYISIFDNNEKSFSKTIFIISSSYWKIPSLK